MKWILVSAAFAVLGLAGCNKQEAAVSGKNGEGLTLNAPRTVTIRAGDTAPVKVSITRKQFEGPVKIDFAQLPAGVTVTESDWTIPKGVTEMTFTLKAADKATGQGHAVKVSASAEGMTAGPVEFALNVSEGKVANATPDTKKEALKISVPKSVDIHPGETAALKVSITRTGFNNPVKVDFAQLPPGVTVVESDRTIPQGASEISFTLKAADNATGQGHAVKVSASGEGMTAGPAEFTLNVTARKAMNLEQKRKDLDQHVRAALAETNNDLAKLEAKAKVATGSAKVETDAALGKLRQSRDELEKRLEQSGTTSEEAWDRFSTGVHSAALDLQKASRQAWDRMKD